MQQLDERLSKTIENLKQKFQTVRTGRANPDLLASVKVEYYGSLVPLQQVGNVSSSEGNTLIVNVFDGSAISSVEKAILQSDLGLNPQTDGSTIRLRLPDLTQDRREELVRYVKKIAEEAKVALRNIRRDELDSIKKDDSFSDDEKKRESETVQKRLDTFINQIDDLIKQKEEEIRTI